MPLIALPAGPFTATVLAQYGLTGADLRREHTAGRVRRVLRGVYVDSALPDTIELRTAALGVVVGPDQVVVDRTAAWLHGVDTYGLVELRDGPPIEACCLRGGTRSRRTGVRGRTRDLAPVEVMDIGGVRVTTPLRTALDLGCHLRRREAYAALCGLARAHGIERVDLAAGGPRFQHRRGVVQLRELVSLVDPRVESAREAWTLLALHDAGLPLPEPQVWIDVAGVPTYRLDFAYRERRICVEYDGFEAHERTAEQRRYDRERRAWLREHGWRIIVLRAGDFTGEALQAWLRELRALLADTYTTRRW